MSRGHPPTCPSALSQSSQACLHGHVEIVPQLLGGRLGRGRRRAHDDRESGRQGRQSIGDDVPESASHPIAHDSAADGTTDNEAGPGHRRVVGPDGTCVCDMDDQRSGGGTGIRAHHRAELVRAPDAPVPGKHGPGSGGQPGATLAATGREHGPASPGAHPGAEAVRASTATVVGLEGALHAVILASEGRFVCEEWSRADQTAAGHTSSWLQRYATVGEGVKRVCVGGSARRRLRWLPQSSPGLRDPGSALPPTCGKLRSHRLADRVRSPGS